MDTCFVDLHMSLMFLKMYKVYLLAITHFISKFTGLHNILTMDFLPQYYSVDAFIKRAIWCKQDGN